MQSKSKVGLYYEAHAGKHGLVGACILGHIESCHKYHSNKKGYKGYYQISYAKLGQKINVTPKTVQRFLDNLLKDKQSPLARKNMGCGEKVSYGYKPTNAFYTSLNDVDKMSITKSPCGQNVHNDVDKMSICIVDKMSNHIVIDNNKNITKGESEEKTSKDSYPFNTFFDAYGKPQGRNQAEQIWQQMGAADKKAALAHVAEYVKSTPEQKWRKNVNNYLADKIYKEPIAKKYPFTLDVYKPLQSTHTGVVGKTFFYDLNNGKVFNGDGTPTRRFYWDSDVGLEEVD